MSDIESSVKDAKVSDTVSTETAILAISLLLFLQQNQDLIDPVIRFLANQPSSLPSAEDLKQRLEPSLKRAAEILVTAQVLNGFVRDRTPERAVTFIYIAYRYVLYVGNTPTRGQSIELWQRVWSAARQFPIVADEYAGREQTGDLKDWIDEVQNTARRQLRTFKRRLPKIQENITNIYNKAYQTFLGET